MSETRRFTFPATRRIKKRSDYLAVQRRGDRLRSAHFLMQVLDRESGPTRLGVTVSKKIGNAAVRNRVKRLVREFFRQHYQQFPDSVDLSVIARRYSAGLNYTVVAEELKPLLALARDQEGHD